MSKEKTQIFKHKIHQKFLSQILLFLPNPSLFNAMLVQKHFLESTESQNFWRERCKTIMICTIRAKRKCVQNIVEKGAIEMYVEKVRKIHEVTMLNKPFGTLGEIYDILKDWKKVGKFLSTTGMKFYLRNRKITFLSKAGKPYDERSRNSGYFCLAVQNISCSFDLKSDLIIDNIRSSKYGGVPFLLQGESWPKCKNCGKFMHFFFQLRTDDLPVTNVLGDELQMIQLFRCCAHSCYYWYGQSNGRPGETYGKNMGGPGFDEKVGVLRVLNEKQIMGEPNILDPNVFLNKKNIGSTEKVAHYDNPFPCRLIEHKTKWKIEEDYPCFDEVCTNMLGITNPMEALSDESDYAKSLNKFQKDVLYDVREGFMPLIIGQITFCDKFLGYPKYFQNFVPPKCKKCGMYMGLLYHLYSYYFVPFGWSNRQPGCMYIYYCAKDKELSHNWETWVYSYQEVPWIMNKLRIC